MNKPKQIRITCRIMAAVVVLAVVLFIVASLFYTELAVTSDKNSFSLSSQQAILPLLTWEATSPLCVTQNMAEMRGTAQAIRSFKQWLDGVLLLLVSVFIFSVIRTRGLSYHFRQAVACTSLISISIGGHAPPSPAF